MPFLRNHAVASSTSLLFCASAFLQSIIPAPVASRSCFTSFASTLTAGASSSFFSSFGSSFSDSGSAAFTCVWAATSAAKSSLRFSIPSPRLYRVKRRMEIFSPISAVASFTSSSTVLLVSLM